MNDELAQRVRDLEAERLRPVPPKGRLTPEDEDLTTARRRELLRATYTRRRAS